MFHRIVPCVGILALGFVLSGCADTASTSAAAPPGHAKLDSGASQTGDAGTAQSGGAAAVGTQPSGAVTTTPAQ